MNYELTQKEESRFNELRVIVKSGLEIAFQSGVALAEIRDSKLYRKEFKTFEEFCRSEFKIARRRAYQLIDAARIFEELPENVQKITQNESHIRALSKIPRDDRMEILNKIQNNGKITAEKISKSLIIKTYDKTGFEIPENLISEWERSERVGKELMDMASKIKCTIERSKEINDSIFSEITTPAISYSTNLYESLKCISPYAVCTSCQGHDSDRCTLCKRRGFISKYLYDHAVPEETKSIRKKALRKI